MPPQGDPSLHRRKLRLELRRARENVGLTQREAAERLDWSLSKIIRIETGTVSVSVTDLRALLQLYQVEDVDMVTTLEHAARSSKGNSWWSTYSDVIVPQYGNYLGYESAATSIHTYHPIVIPGHLQTQDYSMALLQPRVDEMRATRVVDLRMARQERLFDSECRIEKTFIVDEAALRRQIGGDSVMRHQMMELAEKSTLPDVKIRVYPFNAGAHYSSLGSFILLGFPDDGDLLYLEHATGSMTGGEDLHLLARYQECFESILERSLDEESSVSLILHLSNKVQ
ncbi:helix-turn-helix transcriptional regulator [Streptomyces sp. NPDC023998]|uniref:helix-turn-helix domain-containing protein n=1 Tax=Streptomyces sp. NPDC023998 TaxID=3154597 RepID=UPI0033CAC509